MSDLIYPRSIREQMGGWVHLPRYIDKCRLHLAGKLHADYQGNLGIGHDGRWLKAAGLTHEQFLNVVKGTITDGQVADWVLKNVRRSDAQKQALADEILNYPPAGDAAMQERLRLRKAESGLSHRDDIKTFADYIDADEKRT